MIQCPLAEDILVKFLSQDNELFTKPIHLWCPKGDYTRAWEERAKLQLGEEAYAHLHFDTFVSNGSVGLLFHSYKHPDGAENHRITVPAPWLWCAGHVRAGNYCEPAPLADIARISESTRTLLGYLPGLQYWIVQPFPTYDIGSKSKKSRKPCEPPDDLMFFSFAGGVGFCGAEARPKVRRKRKGVAA